MWRYLEPEVRYEAEEFDDVDDVLQKDVEEQLRFVMPPMEPWDYLDEYIHETLEDAWPNGLAEPMLGATYYDAD